MKAANPEMYSPRQVPRSPGVWRRVIALPLCVCLLAVGSAQAAENQALTVSASDTERLRDLLLTKRIDAFFEDGTQLRGRVKAIRDGLLNMDINKSTGPNSVPRGVQGIPMNLVSAVHFTRYQGNKRAILGTAFTAGGLGLGGAVATATKGDRSGGAYLTVAIVGIGVGVIGYLWGRKKDKKNVTLTIRQPEPTGGSVK